MARFGRLPPGQRYQTLKNASHQKKVEEVPVVPEPGPLLNGPFFVQQEHIEKVALTPHELFVIKGKHMEKPFTGHLWQCMEIGDYHCALCDAKLFK